MKNLFAPLLLIGCLLLAPLPAQAELTIGGDLRTEFSYAFNSQAASLYDSGVDNSYTALTVFDGIDSVLEVNWQSADKKYRAFVKLGVENQAAETKQTWFQYQADGWVLRFGHAPTIIARNWPNQQLNGALGLDGYGKVFLERVEQIRLMYGTTHRLLLAIENPYKSSVWSGGRASHYLPGLAASAELNYPVGKGQVQVHPWARWELISWEDNSGSDSFHSVDAGLDLSGDFGLIGFIVSVGYGLNSSQANPVISGDPFLAGNRVAGDVTQVSVYGELRIGSLFIGGGYAKAERSDWTGSPYTASAFVNYVIPLGPMEFIPEVVWFDNGEDGSGVDRGDVVFAGLAVHMPF